MNDGSFSPLLGLIMLDTQFPRILGDVGNPHTFAFDVAYELVQGATGKRVVEDADPALLDPFIEAAQKLERRGVKMISTSCGFLAMFQPQLQEAVAVPVLSSSLLQIHMAGALLKQGQKVGVITISADSLSDRHFSGVGVKKEELLVIGLNKFSEFVSVFLDNKKELDEELCRREMVDLATAFVKAHPEIGALVLECTNMPPYTAAIREATGLPVFDVVTMLNYASNAVTTS